MRGCFPVLHHVSIVIVSTAKQMFVTLAKGEDANDKKSYNWLGGGYECHKVYCLQQLFFIKTVIYNVCSFV